MWQIIVGVVLAAGAGLALYNAVGSDDSAVVATAPAAQAGTAMPANASEPGEGAAMTQVQMPTADADFGTVEVAEDDFVLGQSNAPVTIIEYASLTCPHCANFHARVLPDVKKQLVDTGKVRLVYRDFPLDQVALAGSVLARCAGRDRYFAFLDVLFRDQANWARSQNPVQALSQIARLGGMGQDKFDSCLKDSALQEAVLKQRLDGNQKYQVNSTPTLLINGKKYSGGLSFEQIKAVVDSIVPKS
jgi:protein-disulfide isomerase